MQDHVLPPGAHCNLRLGGIGRCNQVSRDVHAAARRNNLLTQLDFLDRPVLLLGSSDIDQLQQNRVACLQQTGDPSNARIFPTIGHHVCQDIDLSTIELGTSHQFHGRSNSPRKIRQTAIHVDFVQLSVSGHASLVKPLALIGLHNGNLAINRQSIHQPSGGILG